MSAAQTKRAAYAAPTENDKSGLRRPACYFFLDFFLAFALRFLAIGFSRSQ